MSAPSGRERKTTEPGAHNSVMACRISSGLYVVAALEDPAGGDGVQHRVNTKLRAPHSACSCRRVHQSERYTL